MNKNKGITLIALVITIVILLILAGIVIVALTGDNGLFNRTKEAKESSQEASARELLNNKIMQFQTYCIVDKEIEPSLDYMKESGYFNADKDIKNIEYYFNKAASINWNNYDTNGTKNVKYAKISLNKYKYVYTINEKLEIIEISNNQNKETENEIFNIFCKNIKFPDTIEELCNNKQIFSIITQSSNNVQHIINNLDVFEETLNSNKESEEKIYSSDTITTEKMSSNTQTQYKSVATSEYGSNFAAYKAFDKNSSTYWYSKGFTNGEGGQAIGYDFGEEVYLYKFVLKPRNNGSDTKSVAKFKLEGSNDGKNWEDIKTYVNDDPTDGIEISKFVNCEKMYKQYRIEYISTFNGAGTTYASVWELDFYCLKEKTANKQIDTSKFESYGKILSVLYANSFNNLEYPNNMDELMNNKLFLDLVLLNDTNVNYIVQRPDIFKKKILNNEIGLKEIMDNDKIEEQIKNNKDWNLLSTEKMESNIQLPYKVISTSEWGKGYEAYKAFDKNSLTFWYSEGFTNGEGGQAIGYDFGEEVYLYKFVLKPRNNGSDTKSVAKFKLEGSNDGKNWTDINIYDNNDPTDGLEISEIITPDKAYRQYRIEYISTFNGSGTTYASVWELEFRYFK